MLRSNINQRIVNFIGHQTTQVQQKAHGLEKHRIHNAHDHHHLVTALTPYHCAML